MRCVLRTKPSGLRPPAGQPCARHDQLRAENRSRGRIAPVASEAFPRPPVRPPAQAARPAHRPDVPGRHGRTGDAGRRGAVPGGAVRHRRRPAGRRRRLSRRHRAGRADRFGPGGLRGELRADGAGADRLGDERADVPGALQVRLRGRQRLRHRRLPQDALPALHLPREPELQRRHRGDELGADPAVLRAAAVLRSVFRGLRRGVHRAGAAADRRLQRADRRLRLRGDLSDHHPPGETAAYPQQRRDRRRPDRPGEVRPGGPGRHPRHPAGRHPGGLRGEVRDGGDRAAPGPGDEPVAGRAAALRRGGHRHLRDCRPRPVAQPLGRRHRGLAAGAGRAGAGRAAAAAARPEGLRRLEPGRCRSGPPSASSA